MDPVTTPQPEHTARTVTFLPSGIYDSVPKPELFKSFWIGGYECATHINPAGIRLDMIAGVQHDRHAGKDYELLRGQGIRTARDGVRWHLIDRGGGNYDFSSFLPMLQAAGHQGIQVIWDICHYGWPDDIDLFSSAFVDRFAQFFAAIARVVREHTDAVPFYTPMNEMSFLAWAASRAMIFPHAHGRDDEIKSQLVRAVIAGVEAVWSVDNRARIVFAEPTIHVLPPHDRPDLIEASVAQENSQWECWDIIAGRARPELGGQPRYLDVIGVNYYHSNQWVHPDGRLRWEDNPLDDRWMPFYKMLERIHKRYDRPMFVAETSHFGIGRPLWIREMAWEVYQARRHGIPVEGICLYPILDRYDWSDFSHWHNSGLWDIVPDESGCLRRVLNAPYAAALRSSQDLLAEIGCV